MSYVVLWFVFAIAVGVLASNRGRSGFGWFVISLFFSPLIGLIFVLVTKNLSSPEPVKQPPTRKCTACAELVLAEAKLCKHCGTELVPVTTHVEQQAQLQAQKEDVADTMRQGLYITGGIVLFIFLLVAIAKRM